MGLIPESDDLRLALADILAIDPFASKPCVNAERLASHYPARFMILCPWGPFLMGLGLILGFLEIETFG